MLVSICISLVEACLFLYFVLAIMYQFKEDYFYLHVDCLLGRVCYANVKDNRELDDFLDIDTGSNLLS